MTFSLTGSPINLQLQSPLFGTLPGEVRNEIFTLCLMQYEDDTSKYPEDSFWYRPGFYAPRKSSSTLLQTCRAAYAEGQKVFLRELEWAFWFDRGPEGRTRNEACKAFFEKLTPQAVEALQNVRFFTQMYWLENSQNLRELLSMPSFRPTNITITIRYSDWWWWEYDAPLKMDGLWLDSFRGNPGLRTLKIEYETLARKRYEMMRIIERNKKSILLVRCEGDNQEGYEGHLTAEKTALSEWKWNGTSKLGGRAWVHHGKADTMEYVVITDTWTFVEGVYGG